MTTSRRKSSRLPSESPVPSATGKRRISDRNSNQQLVDLISDNSNNNDSSSDEEETAPSKRKKSEHHTSAKRNSIPMHEVERASVDRLNYLSRYRTIFEPFIIPKVLNQLNQVLINKQTNPKSSKEDLTQDFSPQLITQPYCMAPGCKMRSYQLEGFSWLVNNYYRSVNCILADEMGLGKTLQSIATIAHLAIVKKLSGPYLVVVPLSVLFNWMAEFKKWCPALRVVRLHSLDKDEQLRLRKILHDPEIAQVVVTTYDTIKTDEGHRIKNENSDVAKACHALRTRFRVILTGTPVQNNLHEFGALLSFLAPNIFTELSLFDSAFALKVQNKQMRSLKHPTKHTDNNDTEHALNTQQIDRNLLANAHYMLKPFVLRRLKSEVEQKLPPKYETKINCPMTETQRELAKALLFKEKALITKLDGDVTLTTATAAPVGVGVAETMDKSKLMSLLAQLRKASNHPFLFPGIEKVTMDGLPTEEIVTVAGKMQVLDKLLKKLYQRGHRVVLFSQYTRTLDIISDYLDMRGYKHSRLDGSTNRVMREVKINLFNKPQSPQFIFCLSTRAGGEGVNLFTADTVILYDSDWNPQVDLQAMARVHRIGQTRVVHVYRLVTEGSVEECIVQRAQRKLFLDTMVNRGSTLQAQLQDQNSSVVDDEEKGKEGRTAVQKKRKHSTTAAVSGEDQPTDSDSDEQQQKPPAEEEGEEPEPSKVFTAVKFGWNSVFSVQKGDKQELSEEDIERLIDRTRGGIVQPAESVEDHAGDSENKDSSAGKAEATQGKSVTGEGWQENQEFSIETFNEHAPLVSIRDIHSTSLDTSEPSTDIVAANTSSKKPIKPDSVTVTSTQEATAAVEDIPMTGARPRRSTSARTVDMMVEGVGMVKVAKFSLDNEDGGFNKIIEKRAARQRQHQEQLMYVFQSGRQVAGRDFEHQDTCQECWDGGDLIVCDLCPMSFHLECLGLKEMPKGSQWFCPHHICTTCRRRVGAATLLFRCECCSLAYCEDCLPAEAIVQGESRRIEALGYRMAGNACYILCSLECIDFFHTEVEPSTTDTNIVAPHQLEVVEAYEHEGGGQDGTAEGPTDEALAPSTSMTSLQEGAANSGTPLNSLDHALNNCLLDDIRERLGYPKPRPASKDPTTGSNHLTTTSAVETNNSSSSSSSSSTTVNALTKNLIPQSNLRLATRFINLGEIPNFQFRLNKVSPRVKSLLFKLVTDMMRFQESILSKITPSTSNNNLTTTSAAAGEEEKNSNKKERESEDESSEEDVDRTDTIGESKLADHTGVSNELDTESITRVFLHTVSSIARAHRSELFPLAEVLGISFVQPILRAPVNLNSENNQKFQNEPKFCWIKEFNRQKLEEAIVALLVLPCPQNLLIQKSSLDRLPTNALPVDSLLLVARHLESLGEHCADGNNQFFTALSVKSKGMSQLHLWSSFYPLGSPAPPSVKHDWLLPAARLFAHMRYPLLEDRALRQLLLTIYRNKYAPRPPSSSQAPANAYTDRTSLHPSVGPSGINMSQHQSSGGYSNINSTSNPLMGTSYRPPEINLSSKQEQVLFMRWLNVQFDAQRKLAPPQPSVAATPTSVTTAPTTQSTTCTAAAPSPTKSTADSTATPNSARVPRFTPAQTQRQRMMELIAHTLRGVLAGRSTNDIIEFSRRCELELILDATDEGMYNEESSLVTRLARIINAHADWNLPAVTVSIDDKLVQQEVAVVDLTSDDTHPAAPVVAYDPTKDPARWRDFIPQTVRQNMINSVDRMMRQVSNRIGITTEDELNRKTQQYEMGLLISARNFSDYVDKGTLPKRLASLVTDFTEYRKSLSVQQLMALIQ